MKVLFVFLFIALGCQTLQLNAQEQPETVHSIIKVYKTFEWYETQFNLWEKETKANPKNEKAWENLYAAARMAKIMAKDETEREAWLKKMQGVIKGIEKNIPETYAYYFIKAWDSSIWEAKNEKEKETIEGYSLKAYALDPSRPDVYPDLMNIYMVEQNHAKIKEIAKQWYATKDISANVYALNYNMLMSTTKNAILLTAGDNDTYPAIVLQNAANLRQDITIINIYLATFSADYRNNIFAQINIPALEGEIDKMGLINHIVAHKDNLPLYFAFGSEFGENEKLQDYLYNVGLAMYYTEYDFNNTSALIHNFENRFLIDHLKFNFITPQFPEQVKRHNLSYVPGLMQLYWHYKTTEQTSKQEEIKSIVLSLVANTDHEKKIKVNFEQ